MGLGAYMILRFITLTLHNFLANGKSSNKIFKQSDQEYFLN